MKQSWNHRLSNARRPWHRTKYDHSQHHPWRGIPFFIHAECAFPMNASRFNLQCPSWVVSILPIKWMPCQTIRNTRNRRGKTFDFERPHAFQRSLLEGPNNPFLGLLKSAPIDAARTSHQPPHKRPPIKAQGAQWMPREHPRRLADRASETAHPTRPDAIPNLTGRRFSNFENWNPKTKSRQKPCTESVQILCTDSVHEFPECAPARILGTRVRNPYTKCVRIPYTLFVQFWFSDPRFRQTKNGKRITFFSKMDKFLGGIRTLFCTESVHNCVRNPYTICGRNPYTICGRNPYTALSRRTPETPYLDRSEAPPKNPKTDALKSGHKSRPSLSSKVYSQWLSPADKRLKTTPFPGGQTLQCIAHADRPSLGKYQLHERQQQRAQKLYRTKAFLYVPLFEFPYFDRDAWNTKINKHAQHWVALAAAQALFIFKASFCTSIFADSLSWSYR